MPGRVLEELLPHLDGRITGLALNVPVPNGSLVDMTMFTRKPITRTAVNEVVRTGIDAKFSRYVEYARDPIVSSDVKLSHFSSTFDSLATGWRSGRIWSSALPGTTHGWGYAHRVVNLIEHLARMEGGYA